MLNPSEQGILKEILSPIVTQLMDISEALNRIADMMESEAEDDQMEDSTDADES